MRIIFACSSKFGLPTLRTLAKREETVCVITQPDRPAGRGRQTRANPVKSFALDNNLPVFQPENINEPASVRKIRRLQPELLLVIAYGQKLESNVLKIAAHGAINLHASLLPKYRGAAPINWAIINGETATGLSVIKMAERMDAGDILAQQPVEIEASETAGQLHDRLAELGAGLVTEVIHDITLGNVEARPQDESRATLAPRLKKSDGRIIWTRSAGVLANFIRGVTPWPGAFTFIKSGAGKKPQRIVISRASANDSKGSKGVKPGEVVAADEQGIQVAAGRGILTIRKLTPAGSRTMTAADFLNGHPLRPGDFMVEDGS